MADLTKDDLWELRQIHGLLLEQAKVVAGILETRTTTPIGVRELSNSLTHVNERVLRLSVKPRE